ALRRSRAIAACQLRAVAEPVEVEACWRCQIHYSRLATTRIISQLARAVVECCALRGLFRGQTASPSFRRTAAENAESGSQKLRATISVGVLQIVHSTLLFTSLLPRQPKPHCPPSAPSAPFPSFPLP